MGNCIGRDTYNWGCARLDSIHEFAKQDPVLELFKECLQPSHSQSSSTGHMQQYTMCEAILGINAQSPIPPNSHEDDGRSWRDLHAQTVSLKHQVWVVNCEAMMNDIESYPMGGEPHRWRADLIPRLQKIHSNTILQDYRISSMEHRFHGETCDNL